MAVDGFIDARLKARNTVLIRLDADIAACAAARTYRRCFLQIPDAYFEPEIAVGQRAHRANVDDVRGERVVENGPGKQRNGRMIAAIDHVQFVCLASLPGRKRTQRVHLMQRSPSKTTFGPKIVPLAIVHLAVRRTGSAAGRAACSNPAASIRPPDRRSDSPPGD